MEVVNARAALLSNYEVLSLLKELEADHIVRTKTLQRIKKEDEATGKPSIPGTTGSVLETSENLRTIEVEAIQYLTSDYLSIKNETPETITKLVKALEPYGLTKAEKLQIVNLVPTTAVELYVIVEELEDRFGDRMEDLLLAIQDASGSLSSVLTVNGSGEGWDVDPSLMESTWNSQPTDNFAHDTEAVYDEEMFDDTGEGAGVEGDLDQEDD